jgi:glycosyltransferase involved in cell wall biosynthesis
MKVCIVTTGAAAAEPRAMKQALALKARWPKIAVTLCDAVARGQSAPDPDRLTRGDVERSRLDYPTRQHGTAELALRKLGVAMARTEFARRGALRPGLFGIRAFGLANHLRAQAADVYVAHGMDTLLPSRRAADALGAKLVFDSMEYYSDMGDQQSSLEKRATDAIQTKLFASCDLILAASDDIADRLAQEYQISRPVAVYNTPSIEPELPPKSNEFSLYWRNYQIGFGQRGLEDALVALSLGPKDIKLYLQGRTPHDGGAALSARVSELGLTDRVILKPPFPAGRAVREAAPHTIGLCLERSGPLNHDLTVSNKMFDYLMAGLAVVSSDLPGLRRVVDRSRAGLLYTPGSPDSLAAAIGRLHEDRRLLETLSTNAREYSLEVGNEDVDMKSFTEAMGPVLGLEA